MTHASRDDLTAYALGALDPEEERTIAAHVSDCERCTAELRHLAPAVSVLAESVEQQPPPLELRERLMSTVRAEAAGAASGAERRRRNSSRFDLRRLLMRPAAGLVAVALIEAGIGGYLIAGGDDGKQASTVAVEASQPGAGGSLVVENDAATLKVHGMPALDKGAVYQVWVADGSLARPSATFVPHEDGTATAAVPEVLGGGDQVMVTEEPRAGRRSPTLPSILSASIN